MLTAPDVRNLASTAHPIVALRCKITRRRLQRRRSARAVLQVRRFAQAQNTQVLERNNTWRSGRHRRSDAEHWQTRAWAASARRPSQRARNRVDAARALCHFPPELLWSLIMRHTEGQTRIGGVAGVSPPKILSAVVSIRAQAVHWCQTSAARSLSRGTQR